MELSPVSSAPTEDDEIWATEYSPIWRDPPGIYEIPTISWAAQRIRWNESALEIVETDEIPKEAKEIFDFPCDFLGYGNRLFWKPVTIAVSELVRAFPDISRSFSTTPVEQAPRLGRARRYDWDAMYVHLIAVADLDGLPDQQSECERLALDWFGEQGLAPSEATVREKISPIYNHPRRRPGSVSRSRGRK